MKVIHTDSLYSGGQVCLQAPFIHQAQSRPQGVVEVGVVMAVVFEMGLVMAVVVELEAGIVGVGEVGEVDVVLMAVMVEIGVVVEVGVW